MALEAALGPGTYEVVATGGRFRAAAVGLTLHCERGAPDVVPAAADALEAARTGAARVAGAPTDLGRGAVLHVCRRRDGVETAVARPRLRPPCARRRSPPATTS